MTRRAAISIVSLILLLVFLLGLTLEKLDKETKARRQFEAALALNEKSVVDKIAEFITPIIRQEVEALREGQTPTVRVETVLEKLKGIDPDLIKRAVEQAYREQAAREAQARAATSTTTTATTTTTRPPSTTTTSATTTTTNHPGPPSSVTTTTRCLVNLPPLAKVGCQ